MICVECNADEAFLKALGFPAKEIKHREGKFEVINYLKKQTNSYGLIDEDPGTNTSNYPAGFSEIQRIHGFRLLEKKKSGNKIIELSPTLEGWILNAFNELGDLELLKEMKIPDSYKDLHTELSVSINEVKIQKRLKSIVDALMQRKSRPLISLREIITQK